MAVRLARRSMQHQHWLVLSIDEAQPLQALVAPLQRHFDNLLGLGLGVPALSSVSSLLHTCVWRHKCSHTDLMVLQLCRRQHGALCSVLQSLVPLMIEGGSSVSEATSDERWHTYLLCDGPASTILGFVTFYHFPCFPQLERIRARLSQFVIWPPFQAKGYGRHLYVELLRRRYQPDPVILEVTGKLTHL